MTALQSTDFSCWIDCGVNLPPDNELARFRDELDAAEEQGVGRIVLIASDVAETRRAIAFAEQDPRCIVTAGVHPHQAAQVNDSFIADLKTLSQHPSVRAIGECGLDYNRNYSPPDIQRRVFAAQVELAIETGLPLYLHERDALGDQLAILQPAMAELSAAFTHCFTGDVEALAAYQDLGCYIGITGWVCDERRGQHLAEAVPAIDSSRLLLETDAPYLLPRNVRPRPKSRRNKPQYLVHIATYVAERSAIESGQLQRTTYQNAMRLFGAW
ncbi:hydrolase TatD [Aliidiomarina sedimenti]|uniref:Hydrolase TatD n=1 Tax=Aliidiomarina sedimenti TaxID=1933879 RepID=A0ABY0BXX2_9GAMM|nr:TatD family hydrolase [Aliidiomarina sedimenti]RUO29338.1 hydrolase TatD [Aliidiomarina sedimenti]